MRKLIMWNIVTLDGYFEGVKYWDLPWHEQVWGEELERLSLEHLESADMLVVFADIERSMARQRAAVAKRPKNAPLNVGATGT
jgi:hypothetical protein